MTDQQNGAIHVTPVSEVFQILGNIGKLPEFKLHGEWSLYEERMEQYFEANMVDIKRRVAVLLTAIGEDVYKILRDICDPKTPASHTYDELIGIMRNQFAPRTSVFRKRNQFYELKQSVNESINDWFVRVKNAAISCKFGNMLDDVLKDKFVSGLLHGSILDRICEEDHSKSLNDILDVALKKESSVKQGYDVVAVNKFKSNSKGGRVEQSKWSNDFNKRETMVVGNAVTGATLKNGPSKGCFACGKFNHNYSKCKYRTYKCKICHSVGHLANVCSKEKSKNIRTNAYVETDSKVNDIVNMFNVGNQNCLDPIILCTHVNRIPIDFELDSGAGVSLLPDSIYKSNNFQCNIVPTKVKLKMYNGLVIEPLGEIYVTIQYKSVCHSNCKLIVVKSNCRPLFGRDLMNIFKIQLTNINNFIPNNIGNEVTERKLELLIKENSELFLNKLGTYKYEEITLKVAKDAKPIFHKPRVVPYSLKVKVDEELNKLIKEGVIVKTNNSSWGSPLVPVMKGDGSVRLCADYKVTVNRYLEDFQHPLPRIEELFQALQGGKHFTKLDFLSAYNQLRLTEETKKILAWSTNRGIFLPTRLPFGTKPASNIFQHIVEKLLQGLKGVINFQDDVVVTGSTDEEHLDNLKKVFERLSDAGLRLKLSKCVFFQSEIQYLGHIVSAGGIKKNPEAVKAILQMARPKTVSEIRAYTGMVNFYGRFLPKLASILEPLYALLRKEEEFKWSEKCEKAFQESKKLIASDSVLVHYDMTLPLKVCCDASQVGIGSVLLQITKSGEEKPICFTSRVLSSTEKKYSVIHREALAIYWGVLKFSQFLLGRKFTIVSDHKPLLAIFGKKNGIPVMSAGRLQRWAIFLSEFDYNLEYIEGKKNGGADGLSRLPVLSESNSETNEEECEYIKFMEDNKVPIDFKVIKRATREDSILGKIVLFIETGWPEKVSEELKPYFMHKNELSCEQNVIMWGYRVVIPIKLRTEILNELHSSHMGISKTKSLARGYFWWPNIDSDIESLIKNCDACMTFRSSPPQAKVIYWPQASKPFQRIHIDFLGPINQKNYLIVTDAYSKWPEVFETNKMDSKVTLDFLRQTFARFGLPDVIVSDNGTQFTSAEFEEFCFSNGIKHTKSAPYHPATNGAAENAVKSFKSSMSRMLKDQRNINVSMNTLVYRYLLSYRTTPHWVTNETPAKLMLGRQIKTRLDFVRPFQFSAKPEVGTREESFKEGQKVYVKDYKNPNKVIWKKGSILKILGERTYLVKCEGDTVWKRHLDQIISVNKYMDTEVPIIIEETNTKSNDCNKELKVEQSRPKRLIKKPKKLNL